MADFIFKSRIYYLLIALGIYLVELVILYYLAPAMVNLPLILMATGLLLILLGVALRLAGELLTRRTE